MPNDAARSAINRFGNCVKRWRNETKPIDDLLSVYLEGWNLLLEDVKISIMQYPIVPIEVSLRKWSINRLDALHRRGEFF